MSAGEPPKANQHDPPGHGSHADPGSVRLDARTQAWWFSGQTWHRIQITAVIVNDVSPARLQHPNNPDNCQPVIVFADQAPLTASGDSGLPAGLQTEQLPLQAGWPTPTPEEVNPATDVGVLAEQLTLLGPNTTTADPLSPGAARLLSTLGMSTPGGLTKTLLARQSGMVSTSADFDSFLNELKDRRFVGFDRRSHIYHAAVVPALDPVKPGGASVAGRVAMERALLKAGTARMFDTVVNAGNDGIERCDLFQAAGLAQTTCRTYLSVLKAKNLVRTAGTLVQAAAKFLTPASPAEHASTVTPVPGA